jgi:tetratricopeptide (TPR) repeat protein
LLAGNAEALFQKGEFKGSLLQWTHLLELEPESAEAFARRSETLKMLGDYKSALADLTYAIKLDPQADSFFFQRFVIRRQLNDAEGANEDLNRAITLAQQTQSTDGAKSVNLALYLLASGQTESAKRTTSTLFVPEFVITFCMKLSAISMSTKQHFPSHHEIYSGGWKVPSMRLLVEGSRCIRKTEQASRSSQ